MEIFLQMIIFLLGLCAGSFVNMLVYRTASRYGITNSKLRITNDKRSVCDFCGKQLKWYENVPVVSWMILGGKSRCCGKKLPLAYPIVEITTGLLFLLNYQLSITNYELSWKFSVNLVVITMLVFLAVFDYKYMILPDFAEYILIVIALIRWQNILVGLGCFVIFWLLAKLKIKGQQAMGEGDAPLAAFMGLYLGWPLVLVAFYVAFISGAIVGGGMMLAKIKRGDSQIPFGPFLILGTFIAWWWGEAILKIFGL
jgi:leader peptidase (prepilin peptidase) / N-methyltransferase